MDFTTAQILQNSGFGKLQSNVDNDLKQQNLISPFNNILQPKNTSLLENSQNQDSNILSENTNNKFVNMLKADSSNNAVGGLYKLESNNQNLNLPTNTLLDSKKEDVKIESNISNNIKNNIFLSSDKSFQESESNKEDSNSLSDVKRNTITPHKRLNNVLNTLSYNDYVGYSYESRNYKGLDSKDYERFDNFKTANLARKNLLEKMKEKLGVEDKEKDYSKEDEVIKQTLQTHSLLEKITHSLENEKKKYGVDSKEYKELLASYQKANPIIRDHNITGYETLANYYNSQLNNLNSQTTNTQNNNVDSNIESNNQNTQNNKESPFDSIESIVRKTRELMSNKNKEDGLSLNEKGALEGMAGASRHIFQNIAGDYNVSAYNQSNEKMLHDNQITGDSLIAILKNNGLDNFIESNKDLKKDTLATYIDSDLLSRGTLRKVVDVGGSISEALREKINEKEETFNQFFSMGDSYFSTDKATTKQWKIYKDLTRDYLRADSTNKEELKQKMDLQLENVENAWNNAPAKQLAGSKLIEFASTIKNEHDVGRLWNILKDEREDKALKQAYLNDMMNVLRTHKDFQDIQSMNITKHGDLIAIDKDGKAYSLNTSVMSDIINAIGHSKAEIAGGLAGSIAGAKMGLKTGKSPITAVAGAIAGGALGTMAGSLTDSQINGIVTGYINKDKGFKKALEGGILSIGTDGIVLAGGKTIQFLANSNINNVKNTIKDASKKAYKTATHYVLGENLQSTQNLMAKTLLTNDERATIQKQAMQEVFNKTYQINNNDSLRKVINNDLKSQGLGFMNRLSKTKEYDKTVQRLNNELLESKMQDIVKGMSKYEKVSFDSNKPLMGLMQDLLENKGIREERDKFLKVAMTHPQLSNTIITIANKNPAIASNLSSFITSRAEKVGNSIKFEEKLDKKSFNDFISGYEKELKKEYERVENNLIQSLDHENFKHVTTQIIDILENLKDSIPRVEHKGIINDLQSFGAKSWAIQDLFSLRKAVNEELRSSELKKPSIEALKNINNVIDTNIKEALDKLSKQSNIPTSQLWNQYKNINSEYADFKELTKSDLYSKTLKNNKTISEEEFTRNILQLAKKTNPKGKNSLSNESLKKISKNMPANLQALAIQEAINKNTKIIKGNDKAIAWDSFIQDLEAIKPQITNEKLIAKIELFQDMKQFYNNDLSIAKAISKAVGEKPQSYLSNSFAGKIQMYFYNTMYRVTGRFNFSERSANLAFENHLRNALKYARSTKELNEVIIQGLEKDIEKKSIDKEESKAILNMLKDFKTKFNIPVYQAFEDMQNTYRLEIKNQHDNYLLNRN